jgi:phosphatidylinositol 3-kinase
MALEMLPEWAKVGIADALDLLSSSFLNPVVRLYAVKLLEKAPKDQIEGFLLQLVQALRFEPQHPNPLSEYVCVVCGKVTGVA